MLYKSFTIILIFISAGAVGQPKKNVPKVENNNTISDTVKVRIYIDVEDGKYLGFIDGYAIRTLPLLNGKPVQEQMQVKGVNKMWADIKERIKEMQPYDWK